MMRFSTGEKLSHHQLQPPSTYELHDEVLHAAIGHPLLDCLLHQGIGCPVHQVASGPTIASSKKSAKSSKSASKLTISCMEQSRQLLQTLLVLVFLAKGISTSWKDAK